MPKTYEVVLCQQCLNPENKTVAPYHKITVLEDMGEGKCGVCHWHTKALGGTLKKINVSGDKKVLENLVIEALTDLYQKDAESYWLVAQMIKYLIQKKGFPIDNIGKHGLTMAATRLEKRGLIEASRIETKWFNSETMPKRKNPGVKTYRLIKK